MPILVSVPSQVLLESLYSNLLEGPVSVERQPLQFFDDISRKSQRSLRIDLQSGALFNDPELPAFMSAVLMA